jgi:hypothetical protein
LRLNTRRYLLIGLLIAAATSAAATAPASASIGSRVIADCNKHLKLTANYTIPELNNALQTLPADIAEYSDCKDVIQQALDRAEGKSAGTGGGGSGSGGGSSLPTALIVVIVILVLGAVTLGAIAIRRRRTT